MASRNRTDDIGIAPSDTPPRADYARDLHAWAKEQARLVREGQWGEVDRENVAEEIESLGRTEFDKLESALRIILLHMLKWDHQPSLRSRSWSLSIDAQRVQVEYVLGDNPSLKPRIGEAIARAYRRARIEAANETGFDKAAFPLACPYGFDEITSRVFER
jgi:hypothetical protein